MLRYQKFAYFGQFKILGWILQMKMSMSMMVKMKMKMKMMMKNTNEFVPHSYESDFIRQGRQGHQGPRERSGLTPMSEIN